MLVLTRKIGESIRVGDGIIIKILETGGGQAKIGISAPPQMPIHREEIYLRIREENLAAAQGHKAVESLKGALTNQLEGLPKFSDAPDNPDNS